MTGEAFVVAGALVVVAVVTGSGQALCDRLGGSYTPQAAQLGRDVCPGGSWLNLFRSLPKPVPQFDKK